MTIETMVKREPEMMPASAVVDLDVLIGMTHRDPTDGSLVAYWKKIVGRWGDRRLDEPTPSEIKQLGEHIRTTVVVGSNSRGGTSAVENFITAIRCVYTRPLTTGSSARSTTRPAGSPNPAGSKHPPEALPVFVKNP